MNFLHSVDRMEQELFKKKHNIDYPDLYVVALVLHCVGTNLDDAAEMKVVRKYLREIRRSVKAGAVKVPLLTGKERG